MENSVSEQRLTQEEVTNAHSFDVMTPSLLEMGASQGEGPGETWDNECGQKQARIQVGPGTKAKLMPWTKMLTEAKWGQQHTIFQSGLVNWVERASSLHCVRADCKWLRKLTLKAFSKLVF